MNVDIYFYLSSLNINPSTNFIEVMNYKTIKDHASSEKSSTSATYSISDRGISFIFYLKVLSRGIRTGGAGGAAAGAADTWGPASAFWDGSALKPCFYIKS